MTDDGHLHSSPEMPFLYHLSHLCSILAFRDTDQVRSGQVRSGQVRSGQVRVFNVHIQSKLL